MNWFADILRAFTRGLSDLSPGCKQSVCLQSAALDQKLPFRQRLGLKIHLLLCKWCRRYGKRIGVLRAATGGHRDEEPVLPPQTLSAEARERIKRKLEAHRKQIPL